MLSGDAGLGKTTLWTQAVAAAAHAGWGVLSCRASATERMLDFVGLSDLLSDVDADLHRDLSPAKRRALEAVLLRGDAAEPPEADLRAVFAATLDVLERLARDPLLIAIDDWRWLDRGTAAALAFAARRLRGRGPVFLLTERSGPISPADGPAEEEALVEALELRYLELAPLAPTAIRQILEAELDLGLPARRVDELHRRSAGNPLFALELGRALLGRDDPAHHAGPLRLPERLETALSQRLASVGRSASDALLAATLGRDLTEAQLRRVVGEAAISDAERAQLLVREDTNLRLAHPLLGEVAGRLCPPERRRDLHRRIAEVVDAPERTALHLAAATDGPDPAVAGRVFSAARTAGRQAAISAAVALGEAALDLTPTTSPERIERLLWLGEQLVRAGQLRRAGELLGPAVAALPPGPERARARYLRGWAVGDNIISELEEALVDAGPSGSLRARILHTLGMSIVLGRCRNLEATRGMMAESLDAASAAGDADAAEAARALTTWIDAMQGARTPAPVGDIRRPSVELHRSRARAEAVARLWRGELTAARDALLALLDLADERGEHDSYYVFRLQLCELELRAGRWAQAARYIEEWDHDRGEGQSESASLLRCRALLAVGRGDLAVGRDLAGRVIADDGNQSVWQRLEALRILGLAHVLDGRPESGVGPLTEVWSHCRTEGIDNPGTFPAAPDLVRGLIATEALAEAGEVHERLATLAEGQGHPWGRVAAAWTAGQLAAAEGRLEGSADALGRAAEGFAELGFAWDAARALVDRGLVERRLRRRAAARATLEAAAVRYEEMGSSVFGDAVRTELARLGGRTPSGTTLTPTEQRVAALVADGLSNKLVAAELVVSIGAVEAHLTRIYAKLGVRSRAELMRSYRAESPSTLAV